MGIGLTTAWVIGLALYLKSYGRKAFWDLDLNEVGDFFAGATAPLAFLWLLIAVLLQMIELGLQREELRQSREALEASAAEQKALVRQTQAAAEISQRSLARQQHADQEERLHKLLDAMAESIRRVADNWGVTVNTATNMFRFNVFSLRPQDEGDDVLWRARETAADFCAGLRRRLGPEYFRKNDVDSERLDQFIRHLERIRSQAKQGNHETVVVRLEQLGIDDLIVNLREAKEVVGLAFPA